jgi:hypothetical protein
MGMCETVPLTNCFEFRDGTVEGEIDPLSLMAEIDGVLPPEFFTQLLQFASNIGLLLGPTALQPCFEIPQMGSSQAIDEVYDGLTVPEVVVGGVCADLISEIDRNQSIEIPAHIEEPIDPSNTEGSSQTDNTIAHHATNGSLHTLMTPPTYAPDPIPQAICQLGPCSIEDFG